MKSTPPPVSSSHIPSSRSLSRRSLLQRLPLVALAGGLHIHVRGEDARKIWMTGNPVIDKAREVALNILKPTQAQIEHAWELHFQSLVFESYGFAPRFAIDGERISQAMASGASRDELADLRESMSMNRGATSERERKEFFDTFHAAGVAVVFQNAGEEGSDPLRLIKRLAHFTHATDMMKPQLTKVVTVEDALAVKKAGHVGLCFTGNGVPLRQEWESTKDELRFIPVFHELGIRMMHLTYNRRNPIGDGAGEPHDGGLSDFGHAAVAEMNRTGVIVDVAHSGWKTAGDAARASSKPMVASHTSCADVYRHFRGKPDAVIKAICDTDGLVGMCCIPRFLGGSGDINALLDHLDHMIKKFGAQYTAIGVDTAYVSRFDKEERLKIKKRPDGSSPLGGAGDRWEHLWPKDDFQTTLEMDQSIAWTNWPIFTLGMVMRGHSDEAIRKVLGENVMRVLKANAVAAA
ncbi:membrane dipeptidase [Roseimicrobium gellanilyticum]|uniref:Membrane dipeptidase n=1 Tax=Roseimicrobium gellanilyticum TaxID=748857 RepID=A0A366HMG5_9BACT|nr:membrane dipeptidase [Roseimicrobium gellanilyticum]RBP43767.1 membrane dipeptidase [Roseimicrobium gellanilyticum]